MASIGLVVVLTVAVIAIRPVFVVSEPSAPERYPPPMTIGDAATSSRDQVAAKRQRALADRRQAARRRRALDAVRCV